MSYKNLKLYIPLLIIVLSAFSCSGNRKKAEAQKTFPATESSYVEVSIGGMSCTDCEQTIQRRLTGLQGVKSVKASFTSGTALVEYYPEVTDTVEIKTAITGTGYIVKKFTPVPKPEIPVN